MKTFKSDNYSGIHPNILKAIETANFQHTPAYGGDEYTSKCDELFETVFGLRCKTAYAFSGTGANVLALKIALRQSQAVICATTAHINTNETGAPESIAGVKLYKIETPDGKITPEQIKKEFAAQSIFGRQRAKPKMVSITQPTEFGTLYTISELQAIRKICTELDLYLHVDCCRVYNAAAALGCNIADLTSKILPDSTLGNLDNGFKNLGADIISLGGTKLGCMLAESVVVFNPKLWEDLEYLQKNTLQLYSKNRFIAAQYLALFENNLWQDLAQNQNKIAKTLEIKLTDLGLEITQKVETNHIFVKMNKNLAQKLEAAGFCYVWPNSSLSQDQAEIRLVLSFDNDESDVEKFIEFIKSND